MTPKNKEFTYYNYKFNIKIEVIEHFQIADSINGINQIPVFEITTNDMGPGSYYHKVKATPDILVNTVNKEIKLAKEYVDNLLNYKKEQWEIDLDNLGFK